jgi:hypothetical protein
MLPTSDTTGAVTKNFGFSLSVPIAYDKRGDLSGAIVAQTTSNGQIDLNINFANTLVGDVGNVYTAGTAQLNNIYISV